MNDLSRFQTFAREFAVEIKRRLAVAIDDREMRPAGNRRGAHQHRRRAIGRTFEHENSIASDRKAHDGVIGAERNAAFGSGYHVALAAVIDAAVK